MIDFHDYAAVFGDLPVPAALQDLLRFQNEVGYGDYSQALTLSVQDHEVLAIGWSDEDEFLDRMLPFAQASASGAFYVLWNPDPSLALPPDRWPVVVFGDEGGEWVIARDVRELLRVSTCDVEPMIDMDRVHYYRSEHHYRKSAALDRYVEWLRERFQIAPLDDPEEILKAAQQEWQTPFERWMQPILERGGFV